MKQQEKHLVICKYHSVNSKIARYLIKDLVKERKKSEKVKYILFKFFTSN